MKITSTFRINFHIIKTYLKDSEDVCMLEQTKKKYMKKKNRFVWVFDACFMRQRNTTPLTDFFIKWNTVRWEKDEWAFAPNLNSWFCIRSNLHNTSISKHSVQMIPPVRILPIGITFESKFTKLFIKMKWKAELDVVVCGGQLICE